MSQPFREPYAQSAFNLFVESAVFVSEYNRITSVIGVSQTRAQQSDSLLG